METSEINIKEIECRFLEIDKGALIKKLRDLGAKDKGEVMIEEIIVYDSELKWRDGNKRVRLRKYGDSAKLSFKEHWEHTVDGADEVEFRVDDYEKAKLFLEKIGLKLFRQQQKKRHTLELNGVIFDIDTWPRIPTYVELEGESEAALKEAAKAVGYDWRDAVFENPRWVIENKYNIPVGNMRWFTFDRFE